MGELPYRYHSDSQILIELESEGAYDGLHVLHLLFAIPLSVCAWYT